MFFSLYDQYPAFIGLVPLIAALFYAGMVVTVASWQEMVGLQEEKKEVFRGTAAAPSHKGTDRGSGAVL